VLSQTAVTVLQWCTVLCTDMRGKFLFEVDIVTKKACGILDISQPCRPRRPVTGITLFSLLFHLYSNSLKEDVSFCEHCTY
jgi:hypothetical protein